MVTELMAKCAADARELAASRFQMPLDGTFESIQVLENILCVQYNDIPRGWKRIFKKPPTEQQLQHFALLWGGYLGEVLRERLGGAWTYAEEGVMAGAACLDINGTLISPPAKVMKRLLNGPEDDLWIYAYIIDHDQKKEREKSDSSPE